ncbi:ATP-binding protein [Treponema sp. OMZ 305]|uniref:ATP-binding protein n=1 Tax=Treponema sp. OMZ 305 TaxID=1659192 RepID=UPI0020A37E4B|nr:ATP-binding protein [Treponema sp. OMZ 305]
MAFKRNVYLDRLKAREKNGLIKIITGSRRAGKSYLLNEIFYSYLRDKGIRENQIIKFAFDSDEYLDFLDSYFPEESSRILQKNGTYLVNAKKFRAFIKDKTSDEADFYLLLDEVQLLENFVGTLNSLLRHSNFDVYVTGSNSKFLSSDIVTEFKGRGSEVHILPLSFSEYCEGLKLKPEEAWKSYIVTGGIPLVALMKTDEERFSYLKNLCEETYLKDIIEHNRIRKQSELAETFDIIASMIGSLVNSLKLANTFKTLTKKDITDCTITTFIDYFEDAFLISKAKKFNIKEKKYISSPFKIYFEDIGVRNARLNFRQIEESHIMENILYNELRYRGFLVDVGEVHVNEKTEKRDVNGKNIYAQKQLEVDFVASSGSQKFYIQSVLNMDSSEKEMQEKKSLYNIDDSFKKFVITKNNLNSSTDEKGIVTINLFDFLMGDGLSVSNKLG